MAIGKKIVRKVILLAVLVALALGALTYAGCISCSNEKLGPTLRLNDMTMSYPESWGTPQNMDGTSLMGVSIPKAVGVKKGVAAVAALADVSSLGLTPEGLESMLGGYDVTFEPTTIDGKQALRVKGNAMVMYVRAVGIVEGGKLTDVAIVTCSGLEESQNAAQFDAIIDSVHVG